jgi:ring-1,2-phenylacetyl-CoA epoxidase subunit PaaC
MGHRLSEWMSRAPFLEEDIALSNVALDFVGRARLFYQYAAELMGGEVTEDTFAYQRDVRDFTNLLLCELPRGDFAFTLCRQFLYDAFSLPFTQALCHSTDPQLAAIAAKAEKESRYHLRRSSDWMLRLGDGTQESHERCQNALEQLWIYTDEMFECDDLVNDLVVAGVAVNTSSLRSTWLETVTETLRTATLAVPESQGGVTGGRVGIHTDDLGFILAEMQFMQRAYPGLQW